MRWYDLLSVTYDLQLEGLYGPYRAPSVAAAGVRAGDRVLVLPVGTGQDLPAVVAAIGAEGRVLGLDRSTGMLRRAEARVAREGWRNVTLAEADVSTVAPAQVSEAFGGALADVVLVPLGLTAFPDADAAFARLWACLRPGGRFAIVDVHAARRVPQTCMVEWIAQADLDRRVWEPLDRAAPDATRAVLADRPWTFGGELFVAAGTKPAAAGAGAGPS